MIRQRRRPVHTSTLPLDKSAGVFQLGKGNGRPNGRVMRKNAHPYQLALFVPPSVELATDHLAAQTPFFAQKKISAVWEVTETDVVLLIVSCADVAGLFVGLG